jgi:histidine ammonia-lyase
MSEVEARGSAREQNTEHMDPRASRARSELCLGQEPLRIEHVALAARGALRVRVSREPGFQRRIERGARVIADRLERGVPTYGVNTGFGASVKNAVPAAQAALLARNLPRYHGCGVGPLYSQGESRAIMLVRLASLCAGYSGVRPQVLAQLEALLEAGVVPAIPSRGSVGASGDLTPLSYVAALLTGEREAWLRGQLVPARRALEAVGLEPIELGPKESLAIMNGTSVMAALTCLSFARAEALARDAAALTTMALEAIGGQHAHFDARLFQAKAHPGQARCAAWIRGLLGAAEAPALRDGRIQERYSIRCAPHVIGVLVDALDFARGVLETEINGASDNPLIDPDTGDVLHGGNFYGGHVALAADTLKVQVANLADLMERQLVLLNDAAHNGGLPENLVGVRGPELHAHHGFKAMEITASALTAEALKLCMPASVFSRSTENHNQDKVSMGSIAAFDFARVVELVESVAAVHAIACAQAVELRGLERVAPGVRKLHGVVRARVAATGHDRPMDHDIESLREHLREEGLWAAG